MGILEREKNREEEIKIVEEKLRALLNAALLGSEFLALIEELINLKIDSAMDWHTDTYDHPSYED